MIALRFVPLTTWPGHATRIQRVARFRAAYDQTLELLEDELRKIEAREIVVQAFFRTDQIRHDGWPYAAAQPTGAGAIVSFRRNAESFSFPCDRYSTLDDNLRAIALSLQALRAVDRYGVTQRAEQYVGWKQIEAPAPESADGFASKEAAAEFILMQQDQSFPVNLLIQDVELRNQVYRRAVRRLHPDTLTGDYEMFVKLQQAYTMLGKDGRA